MNKIKLALSTIIVLLVFCFVYFLTYNLAEPKAYDFMTKHVLTQTLPFDNFKKVHGSDDIVLVVIDAKTVEKYRWPWKREVNCKIFEYFKYSQPKLIIYDAILATLDKDNPNSDKTFLGKKTGTLSLTPGKSLRGAILLIPDHYAVKQCLSQNKM